MSKHRLLTHPDCRDLDFSNCPENPKEACVALFCKFQQWESWGYQVQKAFAQLDELYDAIRELEDHVYDMQVPDLTKRVKVVSPSPEVGDPPDPPFGSKD
jgi:hypothetical protein